MPAASLGFTPALSLTLTDGTDTRVVHLEHSPFDTDLAQLLPPVLQELEAIFRVPAVPKRDDPLGILESALSPSDPHHESLLVAECARQVVACINQYGRITQRAEEMQDPSAAAKYLLGAAYDSTMGQLLCAARAYLGVRQRDTALGTATRVLEMMSAQEWARQHGLEI